MTRERTSPQTPQVTPAISGMFTGCPGDSPTSSVVPVSVVDVITDIGCPVPLDGVFEAFEESGDDAIFEVDDTLVVLPVVVGISGVDAPSVGPPVDPALGAVFPDDEDCCTEVWTSAGDVFPNPCVVFTPCVVSTGVAVCSAMGEVCPAIVVRISVVPMVCGFPVVCSGKV